MSAVSAAMRSRTASSTIVSARYGVGQPVRSRAARLTCSRHDARPFALQRLGRARLRVAARADEQADGKDEVTEGTNVIEDMFRHDDRELALERQRQLDEIERIGGQVV